jgi:phage shock protein E
MKSKVAVAVLLFVSAAIAASAQKTPDIPNPAIDMKGFLAVADEAAVHRATHRVTEDEFVKMSKEPGVIVLDARSKQRFDELHVKGAINLSFPDITEESLAAMFPDKNAKILIYCNNNFTNALEAFPRKIATASLNLSTYISLYSYGYRNVYELGPLLDAKTTKIELIPTKIGNVAIRLN